MKINKDILSDSDDDDLYKTQDIANCDISHVINKKDQTGDTRVILTGEQITISSRKTMLSDARTMKNILLALRQKKYKIDYINQLFLRASTVKKSLKQKNQLDHEKCRSIQIDLAILRISLFAFAKIIQENDQETALKVMFELSKARATRVLDRARTIKKIAASIMRKNRLDRLDVNLEFDHDIELLWQHICIVKEGLKNGKEITYDEKKLNDFRHDLVQAASGLLFYIHKHETLYTQEKLVKWQKKIVQMQEDASWCAPSRITVINRYIDRKNMKEAQLQIDELTNDLKKIVDQLIIDQECVEELEKEAIKLKKHALNLNKTTASLTKKNCCSNNMLALLWGAAAFAGVAIATVFGGGGMPVVLGVIAPWVIGGVGAAMVVGLSMIIVCYRKNKDKVANIKMYTNVGSKISNIVGCTRKS